MFEEQGRNLGVFLLVRTQQRFHAVVPFGLGLRWGITANPLEFPTRVRGILKGKYRSSEPPALLQLTGSVRATDGAIRTG